jgi:4-hydroxy-tetrahydrodipicolinate synthase
VPKFTGYNLDPSVVIELANEYSQIIGIKDSYGSIGQVSEIIRQSGDKISVLAGSGDLVLATLIMGGNGGILGVANVAPQLCSDIFINFKQGKLEKAKECQMKILYLNEILIKRHNQISSIKEALNQLGKPAGHPRLPSLPLNEEGCQTIQRTLRTLNLALV